MTFVFLSHASPDKKKLRPIVGALIKADIKVWIDNPAAMGFTASEIKTHFHYLEAGGLYLTGLDKALAEANAVLVCWSKKARKSNAVRKEADKAREKGKLVACRIDDVDPETLPNGHKDQHIHDLRTDFPIWRFSRSKRRPRPQTEIDAMLSMLVRDVKTKMSETATRRARSKPPRDHLPPPYLVNRNAQESAVQRAVDTVKDDGGVWPFLIAGPENECLDEFLRRLKLDCAKRLKQAWHEIDNICWPRQCAPGEFAARYSGDLARSLERPSNASASDIAQALSKKKQPVAIISPMGVEEWEQDERERVGEWLAWWRSFENLKPRFAAIPILKIKMAPAKPGWRDCPGGNAPNAKVSNRRFWGDVQWLQKPNENHASAFPFSGEAGQGPQAKPVIPAIDVPPLLHPISRRDAERWLEQRRDTEPFNRENLKQRVNELFSPWRARRHGVNLKNFAEKLNPAFDAP
jgi:hypothetical protein